MDISKHNNTIPSISQLLKNTHTPNFSISDYPSTKNCLSKSMDGRGSNENRTNVVTTVRRTNADVIVYDIVCNQSPWFVNVSMDTDTDTDTDKDIPAVDHIHAHFMLNHVFS